MPERAFSTRAMLDAIARLRYTVGSAQAGRRRHVAGGSGPHLEQVTRIVVALVEHDPPRAADELDIGVREMLHGVGRASA